MGTHTILPFSRTDVAVMAGDEVMVYQDPITGETAAPSASDLGIDVAIKAGTVVALDYTTEDGERHEGVTEYNPVASRIKKGGKLYIIFMES